MVSCLCENREVSSAIASGQQCCLLKQSGQDFINIMQWSVAASPYYGDVIMGAIASQITSLTIVYLTVYSDAGQRKHQSSASLTFCAGNSPVTGEFPAQMASIAENVSIWWRHHARCGHLCNTGGSTSATRRWNHLWITVVDCWLMIISPLTDRSMSVISCVLHIILYRVIWLVLLFTRASFETPHSKYGHSSITLWTMNIWCLFQY